MTISSIQKAAITIASSKGQHVDFKALSMPNMNFRNLPIQGADFSHSNLQSTNFQGSDLSTANFENADLQGASFKNSCCIEVNFQGADLTTANFEGADLINADFTGAKMRGCYLDGAKLFEAKGIIYAYLGLSVAWYTYGDWIYIDLCALNVNKQKHILLSELAQVGYHKEEQKKLCSGFISMIKGMS